MKFIKNSRYFLGDKQGKNIILFLFRFIRIIRGKKLLFGKNPSLSTLVIFVKS